VPEEIASIIADYIKVMKSEVNLSDSYRKSVIEVLTKLSQFCNHKGFKNITRNDILSFLDSFRKPEAADPLHKWIGTYNLYRIHIQQFFKWLYNPEVEYIKRPKPNVIDNIPELKRKEVSIYKPSDLWTAVLESIKKQILTWPNVTAEPHRFGGIEFRLNKREMGHMHWDRLVDLPFPMSRDELVNSGRVSPHHVLSQSGWVSYWINKGDEDVLAVVDLFRMRYEQLKPRSQPTK
jgi:hypothetical protein